MASSKNSFFSIACKVGFPAEDRKPGLCFEGEDAPFFKCGWLLTDHQPKGAERHPSFSSPTRNINRLRQ